MNAAKPSGLQVGSTRPLSRAERRAEAARVKADEAPPEPATVSPPPQDDDVPPAPVVTPDERNEVAEPPVRLKARQRKAKNPFATQLHSGTLARLEWIKARGYAITDTVDEAINTYLDNAGIPRPDHNDRMPS
ncbi:hypothetical protein AN931_23295 [Mycobacterium intracellulare subsp. chimaera]|uniref:hypothetical protein n=1 Tax=Mycobacterium TaxID=1763 RepID=UPI00058C3865|nr:MULTISPECIES: hypothetical protein [Mycobacterium]OCB49424.1 hypothetical protein A9X02_12410 [Mycobacterium malmoense]APD84590.1 hypothetical protein AN480_29175 [Mycobacterium intracellulare subsp. chimaera]KLO34068.1 hypothetical protein ABW17_27150 [Mycobacterium nebraskense]KPN48674.1 hypothetical protein AN931_23295 [Mycobacterium intracellulare subsp. chimaera]MCA2322809.1 hypothetical protein [Mycobacterium intracellulare]